MVRLSRSRAAAAAAQRSPTPPISDGTDEELAGVAQAVPSQEEEIDDDQPDPEEEEERSTPLVDSDVGSAPATPIYGRGGARRKRGGRGRGRARRVDLTGQDLRDNSSDTTTPRRRGGWRGRGFGAGRWAKARGGPSHVSQVPVDKEGNMANVVNDEVELPEDAEGEEKVTKEGELRGEREYRVRTFRIEGKGNRLYMLSTEPARCIGFRDSYLFFQKHKQLYKIIIAEEAKKDLIDRGIIPHSYKGRAIGVVTARSVFREFGSKIIVGGKKVVDDYQVAEARANGDVEGEFAVPEDEIPGGTDPYDRNRYVAWHGASSVYHTGGPSVPFLNGKPIESKKRKIVVTGANWMYEHALQASQFNSFITAQRRPNLEGVYDVHTNFMQYPRIMQPSHVRWEQVMAHDADLRTRNDGPASQASDVEKEGMLVDNASPSDVSMSTNVPGKYSRKFMVTDTLCETPSTSTLGYPGPDEALMDVDPPGLVHVPEDVIAELPSDCRDQFFRARRQQDEWKGRWGSEGREHARSNLRITYNT